MYGSAVALPGGTVTFLFTDIEGSTRLLQELGDDYGQVVADHRRLLRDVFLQGPLCATPNTDVSPPTCNP